MIPGFERSQYVLTRCIGTVQEPNIHDAEMFERPPSFDLADGAERRRLLLAFGIASFISSRSENHGDAFFFIEDRASHIGADHGLVVRMRNNYQKIGLETLIRLWIGTVLRKQKRGQAGHKT